MKKILDFKLLENRELNSNTHLLVLYSAELPELEAGHFVNAKIDSVFLRRPISVCDYDKEKGLVYLLVKIAGKGSLALTQMEKGAELNLILPLGKPFKMHNSGRNLLIGGGVGVAPLYFLLKQLKKNGAHAEILIGARTKADIVMREEFEALAEVHYTTEDGTWGEKGFPTEHSVLLQKFDHIYCCGPEPMMKAVAAYAVSGKIDCQVSLEHTMGCGIGACLCCVTETATGNKCVCTEGAVFNINELKWRI